MMSSRTRWIAIALLQIALLSAAPLLIELFETFK
jgi:hypothetical protein